MGPTKKDYSCAVHSGAFRPAQCVSNPPFSILAALDLEYCLPQESSASSAPGSSAASQKGERWGRDRRISMGHAAIVGARRCSSKSRKPPRLGSLAGAQQRRAATGPSIRLRTIGAANLTPARRSGDSRHGPPPIAGLCEGPRHQLRGSSRPTPVSQA